MAKNNNNIRVDLSLYADSSQAKQEIQSLQQSLSKLMPNLNLGNELTKSLRQQKPQIMAEIGQLQAAIHSSVNQDTGLLDFSKFSQSLKTYNTSLTSVGQNLNNLGEDGQQAFYQLSNAIAKSEIPAKKLSESFQNLQKSFANSIRWMVTSKTLNAITDGLAQAYNYAQKLDRSLNNIRIVTGYSAEKMADFAVEANAAAKALSASTVAYSDAALIFYQQGLDDKAVKERTDATIKMANVTGEMAKEVSSYMTAIWNNFDDGTKSLEYYADVITALGAATAASSEEIAEGMEKFAAIGKTVGLSYEYATAAVATVVAKTRQDADVVGTSFKTLFARLEGLSLGETLEDGTNLNKYSQALASVGVNIKDQVGQLKTMDQILDELGDKWVLLTDDQKVALAQTVGGVRQYAQLIALMDNFDTFRENIEIANESEGTLAKQQRIFEESWKGAQRRLQASWEEFYNDVFDDKAFKNLLDLLSELVDKLDTAYKTIGGIKGVLSTILPIVLRLNQEALATNISNAAYNIKYGVLGGKEKLEDEKANTRREIYESAITSVSSTASRKGNIELQFLELELKYKNRLTEEQLKGLEFSKEQLLYEQDLIEARKEQLTQQQKANNLALSGLDTREAHMQTIMNRLKGTPLDNNSDVQKGIEDYYKLAELSHTMGGIYDRSDIPADPDIIRAYNTQMRKILGSTEIFDNLTFTDDSGNVVSYNSVLNTQSDILTESAKKIDETKIRDGDEAEKVYTTYTRIQNLIDQGLTQYLADFEAKIVGATGGKEAADAWLNAYNDYLNNAQGPDPADYQPRNEQAYNDLINGIVATDRATGQVKLNSDGTSQMALNPVIELARSDIFNHNNTSVRDANDRFWAWLNTGGASVRDTTPIGALMSYSNMGNLISDPSLRQQLESQMATLNVGQKGHRGFQNLYDYVNSINPSAIQKYFGKTFEEINNDPTLSSFGSLEEKFAEYIRRILTEIHQEAVDAANAQFQQAQANPQQAARDVANRAADAARAQVQDETSKVFADFVVNAGDRGVLTGENTGLGIQGKVYEDKGSPGKISDVIDSWNRKLGEQRKPTFGEGFVAVTQSLTTLVSTIQQVSNAFETLADDSASVGQKVMAVATALGNAGLQIGMMASNPMYQNAASNLAGAIGMSLPALLGTAGVIAAITAAVIGAYKLQAKNIEEEIEKNQSKIDKNLEWQKEHEEALKAVEAYEKAKNSVDDAEESLEKYHETLLETAEALGIQNAALLDQAKAYGLLESKVDAESARLKEENINRSQQNFDLAQAQMQLGTNRTNLGWRYIGATGLYNDERFRSFVSSGLDTDEGERKFLDELRQLNIFGVNVEGNGYTADVESMSQADLAKFYRFLADVQTNSALYGGDSNEFIKHLSNISDDLDSIATGIEDSLDALIKDEYGGLRENSVNSLEEYNNRVREIATSTVTEQGVMDAQQAIDYAMDIMAGDNDSELAAQYAVIRDYSELAGQTVGETISMLNGYSEEQQDVIIRAMGANAGATKLITDSYEDETEVIEHLNALLDDLDFTTLANSLEAVQEFISKLKIGSVFTSTEVEDLAYKMGFSSAEKFLEAFGDQFTAVAGDKYKFTGDVEAFRAGVDSNLARSLMEQANSGVNFDETNISQRIEELDSQSTLLQAQLSHAEDVNALNEIARQSAPQSFSVNPNDPDSLNKQIENMYRTMMGIDADTPLTGSQAQYLQYLKDQGVFVTQDASDGLGLTVRTDTSGIQDIDTNAIQQEYDSVQEQINGMSWVEGYEDKYAAYQGGVLTAFQDDLVTQYTTMEELQDLYEQGFITSEKYTESLQAAAVSEAELWGIDTEELERHADALAENNEYLQGNADAAEEVALANERANVAIEDLYDNFDNYKEILNDARVDSEEYNDVMISLGDDLRNLFNYDERVGEDFIVEHLEDIEKAANGDIDAVNDLQIAFAQYRLATEGIDLAGDFADVYAELQATDWDDLEIGVSMDTVPAMQSLFELMLQAGASADAIQDAFNALGFEAQFTYGEGPNGEKVITGIQNSHYVGTNKRGLNAKQDKNKSSKTKKKDEKDLKDEFERYYKITRQIKDQEDATERLNKAKERAYGKAKLEYLDQEADSIEREITLQKEYLDEIRGYYAGDKGNLEAFGATFDENGVLTNYEQLINAELAKYNQAVEAYNANQDEAAFESAEKRFNYFKDVLKQYDETNQLYQAELDKMTDLQNKWYDMALQKTKLKVEMEIDIDDRDLKLLEYAMDRIEKKAFATAEAMAKITESIGSTLDKQKIYQNALEEILGRHGINGIEGINGLTDDQIANLGFTQEEIDAIIEYNADLLDTQEEMDKLQDEILNGPLKAFKEWNEEFDYQEDKIKRNIDLLNQYKNIADLIYSNSSSVTQEYITSLMTNAYDSMVLGVDAARLELEANKDALAKAQASYEEAVANGAGEETLNTLNKNLREMEKAVEDSEDNMLKQTEEALQQAEELFKRAIESAKDSFKELTSVTDWDMTKFDRLKSLDDEYLDDYQKIYEFAKLTRDIENSIDNADTIRSKERLREITQEIADIEAEGREVSQYEVDALRAKYELRLAEIALEDAQNAKSTVRMNRDNEGNWSYVYTADDDNVDKARQNYEDKLYEYQKLNSEFIKSQQENFLKLEQEYTDAMQKIAEDSSLSREDKEARLQETQAYYQRMAEIMSDQLGIALNKNSELYNKDWLDYSKNTGYKISMEEEYQTKLDDTYTGHLQPNIDSATQLLAQFTEAATGDGGYLPTILNSLDEFALRQDEVLQAAGTSLSDYADTMQRTADDIEVSMDEAAAGLVEDFDTIMEKISEINAASFDGLRNSITDAIGSVNDLIAAYERLSSAASTAQDSSISASSSVVPAFPGSGNESGLKNGGGNALADRLTKTGGGNLDRNVTTKVSRFLWALAGNRKTASGAGTWNTVVNGVQGFSDSNLGTYFKQHPGDEDIGSEEKIKQAVERFGDTKAIDALRAWARKYQSGIFNSGYNFDTGGYTGAWGPEGRLAFLHQKELVLNAKDTENMLTMVEMVRDIANSIDLQASVASIANTNNGMFSKVSAGAQTVDQNVHIEASFPNVTNHSEIEQALSNLVNQAAQYANRKS